MTKKELTIIFMEAKANKNDVCVEVTIPGQEDTEYIVNKNKSIDNKLDYYFQTYDDNLVHKQTLLKRRHTCSQQMYERKLNITDH